MMAADSPAAEPAATQPVAEVPTPALYRVGRVLCRIFCTLWFDLKVHGLEHVPTSGGVLLLSNHQSYLDPVLIGNRLPRPLSFLAKSELFKNAFFGWLIRELNAFPVRQGTGDVGAVRETIRRLEEGHALVVFPEGSRTPDGELAPLQSGFALIVRKVQVPIVPVAIEGSFDAWPKGTAMFRPRRITLEFGPAMNVRDMRPAEIVQHVDQTLHRLFDEVRAKHRAPLGRPVVIRSLVRKRSALPPVLSG